MASTLSRSIRPETRLDDGVSEWHPPRQGWLKLNVNASIVYAGNIPHLAAGGGIVRDEKGKFCWAFSYDLGRYINETAAHILVIKRGLVLALEKRIPMLVLESPCFEAVEMIKSSENIEEGNPLGPIIRDCRNLARQPWRIEFGHVRGQANGCARILAEVGHTHHGFIEHDAPPTRKLASIVEEELVKETM